jgi:hypothetical protein
LQDEAPAAMVATTARRMITFFILNWFWLVKNIFIIF